MRDGVMVVGQVDRKSNFKTSFFIEPLAVSYFESLPPPDFQPAHSAYYIEQNQIKRFSQHYLLDFPDDPYIRHAQEWLESLIFSGGSFTHYDYDSALGVALRENADRSPGIYWKQLGYASKGDVISKVPDQLERRVAAYYESDVGGAPWYLWSTALKDELTSMKKAVSKDTRLFFVSPLEHYLASIMEFGATTEALYASAGTHPVLVGLSKGYGLWIDVVFKQLGPKNLSVDASKYDTSIIAYLIYCAAEMFVKRAPNRRVAHQLILEALYALVVDSAGRVFMKEGGNPSGGYLTLVLNCVVQVLLIVRANLIHCGCIPMLDLLLKIVGDDGVYTPLRCRLTPELIIARFADYNVTLKDVKWSGPEGVEFCGVTYTDGFLVPRHEKFYCSMFYGRRREPEFRVARLQSVWMELFDHPRGVDTLDYVCLFSVLFDVPIRLKCLCALLTQKYGVVDHNKLSTLKHRYNGCAFNRSILCPSCSSPASSSSFPEFRLLSSSPSPSCPCSSPYSSTSSNPQSCSSPFSCNGYVVRGNQRY